MKPTKKNGRIIGLLFLSGVITGGVGTSLRGLSGAEANTVEFLNNVVESAGQMKQAISLDMLASAIGVALAIFILPLIRKYSLSLASAYLALACINFAVIAVSNIIHIALLTVSVDYSAAGLTDPQHYTTLSKMLYDAYYWTHFLMLLLYSIGGSVLFYFLFKTAIIPRWLAIWGLLAAVVVFVGGALQLAEIRVSFLFFIQNGIFMLIFIGWLLVKGFRDMDLGPLK